MRADQCGTFWHVIAGSVVGATVSAITQALDNVTSGKTAPNGLALAIASGAITGGLATTGANKYIQATVSGIVAGLTDCAMQVKDDGWKNVNTKQVGVSVVTGVISGLYGGDGLLYKKGEIVQAKNLYDGFIDCVKNRKWNAKNVSEKIVCLANNYRKTIKHNVKKATGKYILGTAGSTIAKRWWQYINNK